MMKYFVLLILLMTCSIISLAQDPKNLTQTDLNILTSQDALTADQELNQLYKTQMNYLTQEEYKNRLRDSQRAWIKYRDATCLYEAGKRSESGSIWPMEQNVCIEILTKQRNKILKNLCVMSKRWVSSVRLLTI